MSDRTNGGSQGTSAGLPHTEQQFRGFPGFRSNVLYCPKQFFTVVIPNSSVNCIRIVSYMLRKTLGWVDGSGEPIQERHGFSYRELEEEAGVSSSRLGTAFAEALRSNFIRRVHKARMQTQGLRAQSGCYELQWDEALYSDQPKQFRGFYLQPTYVDVGGQPRLGRKNIPNAFFDLLVRRENRGVIRVVGTLLWYSISWGKGGERKQPVTKSLRDLAELTRLDKSSVVRALDEAETMGYVERVQKGVFALSGKQQSSITVYGIRWTNECVDKDGPLLAGHALGERFQNATRAVLVDASKTQHENPAGTLLKCDTELEGKRLQNATQDAPKMPHGERFQNATYRTNKTRINNTSTPNNSTDSHSSPHSTAAVAAEQALIATGFDARAAREIAEQSTVEVILQQLAWLPRRRAVKNRLGFLRRAIEENWAAPKTQEEDRSSGELFAASFYAGYHGNSAAPVSEPSTADSEVADRFLQRILEFWPDPSQIENWGRQFGALVAYRHGEQRRSAPALRPAMQQHGDDFYSQLRLGRETERKEVLERAQAAHYQKWEGAYLDYLRVELARNEAENTTLFQTLIGEKAEQRKQLTTDPMARDFKSENAEYLSGRLGRFQQIVLLEDGHGVLDFWEWDKARNPERFLGGTEERDSCLSSEPNGVVRFRAAVEIRRSCLSR